MLILLGCGVVATVVLQKYQGHRRRLAAHQLRLGPGGLRRCVRRLAVRRPPQPGGHPRPRRSPARSTWAPVPRLLPAELARCLHRRVLCWVAFKKHFDEEPEPGGHAGRSSPPARPSAATAGTSSPRSSAPSCWSSGSWSSGAGTPTRGLGHAGRRASLVVVGIGNSLGGPTGYAINPARDLGPRIAYAILPIKGKGEPRLGLLLGADRRPADRCRHRRPAVPGHQGHARSDPLCPTAPHPSQDKGSPP